MRKIIYTISFYFFIGYIIIQILFFDVDFILCLNIDKKILLCDCTLLFLYINYSSLVRCIKFITITKVTNMQILN